MPLSRRLFVLVIGLAASLAGIQTVVSTAAPAQNPVDVNWNRFHTNDETNRIMRAYADRYADFTKVYSIGKSYKGVDLMLIEVTNQKTGPAEEKPALYVDGNIHAGELTGSAVTLYLLGHLLDGYGSNPQITALLDTRVFYIRPKFNPDGADLALVKDASLRSSVRPWDNDNDGALDEDPSEDLNGDGFIVQMRIPGAEGEMKISSDDARLMVRRQEGESGGRYYRVVSEGIDNDADGRLNEDGTGGLDMNRNFPRNWELPFLQPEPARFLSPSPKPTRPSSSSTSTPTLRESSTITPRVGSSIGCRRRRPPASFQPTTWL